MFFMIVVRCNRNPNRNGRVRPIRKLTGYGVTRQENSVLDAWCGDNTAEHRANRDTPKLERTELCGEFIWKSSRPRRKISIMAVRF
jgi:hypothetical protein